MKSLLILSILLMSSAHAGAPNRWKVFRDLCDRIAKDLPKEVSNVKGCLNKYPLEKNQQELFVDVHSCTDKTWYTYYYSLKSKEIKVAASDWDCE